MAHIRLNQDWEERNRRNNWFTSNFVFDFLIRPTFSRLEATISLGQSNRRHNKINSWDGHVAKYMVEAVLKYGKVWLFVKKNPLRSCVNPPKQMLDADLTNVFGYGTIHSFNNTTQFICWVEKQREVNIFRNLVSSDLECR